MDDLRCSGFPDRLKEAREKVGLGRYQLAAQAGLSEGAVRHIEGGRSRATELPTVERLALALGVDPCWLAFGPTSEAGHK